jgi:hypothetical protein
MAKRIAEYTIAVGRCIGGNGDEALGNLVTQVNRMATEQGMVPYGGVKVMLYPQEDDALGWLATQAMVREKP